MPFPLRFGWVAPFAAVLSGASLAADPAPQAELHWDRTPVSSGPSPLVSSYADAVEPARRAVVSISFKRTVHERPNPILQQLFGEMPDMERREEGLGSGVIVSADGYILTNNHVVEGADELEVSLPDESRHAAKLIGADPKTDLAVVKIDGKNLPYVTLADSDRLRVGDIVFAVGNPLAVGETVTMGIVSAKGRSLGLLSDVDGFESFIQTDAAINMGNSGGALVDARGRLVGINCAIVSPSRGSIGIGFAIPVNLAAGVMQSLVATGTVVRGDLGAEYRSVAAEVAEQLGLPEGARGVVVTDVAPGGPAARAGIKRSDIILSVNSKPVATRDELHLMIAELAPGSKAELGLLRDGKPLAVPVTLGRLSEHPDELMAGVQVAPLTDGLRRKFGIDPRVNGILVTGVADDSPYADRLSPDMVISEVNRTSVASLAEAKDALHSGRNLVLVYYRGTFSFVVIGVN